jgi:UDP-N-acetylmuramate dehydrogenase
MHPSPLILADYPLKSRNTFGIDICCKQFCAPASEDEVLQIACDGIFSNAFFVLGGGSNVLFAGNYDGCIIHPAIDFIRKVEETDDAVVIEAGAGTKWDSFVRYCVENNYYGVENLSHIPGTAGAAPVQNIGAYGAEAASIIHTVRYFDIDSNTFKSVSNPQCQFGYRSSIFKHTLKNKAVITAVKFILKKNAALQTHYGALEEELSRLGAGITLQTVRQAIINIRSAKLPDPTVLGNAGSFFKNPVVSADKAQELQGLYPAIPIYADSSGKAKVSAAWLIEQCGWRGKRIGNVGVHPQQALVIVNYGNVTSCEILAFAQNIADDVSLRFNIKLEREVCIV